MVSFLSVLLPDVPSVYNAGNTSTTLMPVLLCCSLSRSTGARPASLALQSPDVPSSFNVPAHLPASSRPPAPTPSICCSRRTVSFRCSAFLWTTGPGPGWGRRLILGSRGRACRVRLRPRALVLSRAWARSTRGSITAPRVAHLSQVEPMGRPARPPYSFGTGTAPAHPSTLTSSHARHRHDGCPPPDALSQRQNAQPHVAAVSPQGHGPGSG